MSKNPRKVMKLLNASTGLMQCMICGNKHWANIKPDSNGNFYPKAWQCANGCEIKSEKQ
jgi:hypothetical protein